VIHQYKLNGFNIVLDVYSGSVHYVDEIAYDIIEAYTEKTKQAITSEILTKYSEQNITAEDVNEVFNDIEDLKNNNQLFTEDTNADIADILKNKKIDIKALCLHVAHTCNLNCEYCFASQGKYHGERAVMTLEVGKQALDFLIANCGTKRNLDVDFFGGEPLMNWKVVKELVAYGRELEKKFNKNIRFTLTTNGMALNDEVIDFLNKEMYNVVLSLDGRKEVHDNLRKTIDGKGSYDTIVPKFQKFVALRGDKSHYVRGTFTHFNTDFTKDLFHMTDLGFKELSMEPVVCAPTDRYALTQEDLPIVLEQYEILAKEMVKRSKENKGFTFYHYMLNLTDGPCIYKRIAGCGSGTEYLAVTPWGELYPCHQFVGEKGYSMGDIWTGVTNTALREQFGKCNAYARKECKDCWAKLYCSGGCAANAYHATGSILGVYDYGCILFKKRIECAIMIKIAEMAK
jgi:uncharacterized protein